MYVGTVTKNINSFTSKSKSIWFTIIQKRNVFFLLSSFGLVENEFIWDPLKQQKRHFYSYST